MAAQYEAQRKVFDGLHKIVSGLAETLGLELPELKSSGLTRLKGTQGTIEIISTKVQLLHLIPVYFGY